MLFKAVEEGCYDSQIAETFNLNLQSIFPIFIQSLSKLLALTCASVYIEYVKEKNLLPANLKIKVLTMKFQLNLVKSILAVAGVAAVSAVSAAPASAIGFSFSNIAGGDNTYGDAYQTTFHLT